MFLTWIREIAEVIAGFEECAAILRERIRSLGYQGPATFYVWHDEQAGQLRCSTTSLPRHQLPFGANVELDPSLVTIVETFLQDNSPGHVSRQPQDFVLHVWTADLGGAQQ